MTHHYDFFFQLDGLIDIAQSDLHGHFDDVLLAALQIYYTSFPITIDALTEGKPTVLGVIDAIRKALDSTTALSQQDIQTTKKECEDWMKEIATLEVLINNAEVEKNQQHPPQYDEDEDD